MFTELALSHSSARTSCDLPVEHLVQCVANLSSCLRTVRAAWEGGHELDDWLQAESEVTQPKSKTVIA